MPRQRRVEYEGAIYHVMARGDRREDIVVDDDDRRRFEETMIELVEKTGWLLFAWVLMNNHYHMVFRTPHANLVDGMSWFQNTWTRRFNTRHRMWGHLFGGRYKAIPVEDGGYLTGLIHYVHLNPVRAGLARRQDGIENYRWCSLPDYCESPRRRRSWVAVAQGLAHMGLSDTATGRRRLLRWTEELVDWQRPVQAGVCLPEGQSLQSALRRGWYFGTEAFRDGLLELLGRSAGDPTGLRCKGYGGEQCRDHGIADAERVIAAAESELGLGAADWAKMPKGDWRKGLVAGLLRRRALVDNGWLAQRLHMGARNAVSRIIRSAGPGNAQKRRSPTLEEQILARLTGP